MLKFTVVGLGYVGMSLATLISTKHEVIALDISDEKISQLNNKKSPIKDDYISEYLNKNLNLTPTTDENIAYNNRDYYIIATPTDYDENTNKFNTSSIENVLEKISEKDPGKYVVIKSTIPIFFTEKMQEEFPNINLIFSPEFLREGNALYDNLYPDRVITSPKESEGAKVFGKVLVECALKDDVPLLLTNTTEAEAIKLFSNTYLAMRVSFFNELDTFTEYYNLSSDDIIKGVSLEKRIGDFYNNPSFGYGGYCLPKDTKQLKANYQGIPNSLISAVVESNNLRKEFIADQIIKRNPKVVGVYKLAMKANSDNFRSSSIRDIMKLLQDKGIEVIVFDPNLKNLKEFEGYPVVDSLDRLKEHSDLIITNRMSSKLEDVSDKVYTRDVFGGN